MSKATREFFEQVKKGQEPSLGSKALDVAGKVWDAMEHPVAHGAHELAAALFNGSAFVMYPRTKNAKEDQEHGLPQEAQQEQERQRGGMEM